jgi:gamma-glutamyltranspeptidase/glutathione hydrolase
MVASTDRLASAVGAGLLGDGGCAVDAAIGVAFALAVVNPEAGNLGGGGFAVVRTAEGVLAALDFRSTAPAAATRDMFLDARGRAVPERAQVGAMAVAVPGSVAGLAGLHERFGRLAWARVVAPAVELARGFPVTERLTRSYPPHIVEGLARFPSTAAVFLPGGTPPRAGTVFRQPDLARTLERIRGRGADGFYRGETAAGIVEALARQGGRMSRQDLEDYRPEWRTPLRIPYRGHTLVSMPPSSSGGVALAQMALMLEDVEVAGLPWHGAAHVHLLAEVWRRAFADRNHYLADPAFTRLPLATLLDPSYARWRVRDLGAEATPSARTEPGVERFLSGRDRDAVPGEGAPPGSVREGDHTTHLSVVDGEGGAVSLTTTLNTWYGSKLVAEGTGVLLNNEMDDLTAQPGAANHFGLVQGAANAVEPGKRPLSAMTPSLLLDPEGRLRLVVGNAGGATILTTVWQVVSSVVDHRLAPAAAVAAPRVHHQHLPDRIQVEPGGLPGGVLEELRRRGHAVEERTEMSGDCHAVAVGPDGTLEGISDPRRGGVAVGL